METTSIKRLCWALYLFGIGALLSGILGKFDYGFTVIILGFTVLLFARIICLNNLLKMDGDRMLWAVMILLTGSFAIPIYLIRHFKVSDAPMEEFADLKK